MTLVLFYIGITLGGFALHYGALELPLIASVFFAQATTLLLVATRPKADAPRIAAVGIYAVLLFLGLAFTRVDYASVAVLPVLLAAVGAFVMYRVMQPKPVFQ